MRPLLFFLFCCGIFSCQKTANTPAAVEYTLPNLADAKAQTAFLELIVDEDQAVRKRETAAMTRYGHNSPEHRASIDSVMQMDDLNLLKIEDYLAVYGHPDKTEHSNIACQAPWLVIHHHPSLDARKKYFPTLYKAYREGNLDGGKMSLYLDRYYDKVKGERLQMENPYTDASKIAAIIAGLGLDAEQKKIDDQLGSPLIPLVRVDYDTTQWMDLADLDSDLVFDIRYATMNNFVDTILYPCGRCWLRPNIARAVQNAHRELRAQGYGLVMYDCYRPRDVQYQLWEILPDPRYVSNPDKGSMHNRGAAVDLGLTDLKGRILDMGTDFDFFGKRAYHEFQNFPDSILQRRTLLAETMEANGFRRIRTEWWHYSWTGELPPLSDRLWPCRTN